MPSSRPARAGLLGLLWLLGSATACTVAGSRPALSGAFATPETAAEAVLLGVWQKDTGVTITQTFHVTDSGYHPVATAPRELIVKD